jgi:hypothetical protein
MSLVAVLVFNTSVTKSHRWVIGEFFSQIMEWTDDNVFYTDIAYLPPVCHLSTSLGKRYFLSLKNYRLGFLNMFKILDRWIYFTNNRSTTCLQPILPIDNQSTINIVDEWPISNRSTNTTDRKIMRIKAWDLCRFWSVVNRYSLCDQSTAAIMSSVIFFGKLQKVIGSHHLNIYFQ